jgi:hypothetical protein
MIEALKDRYTIIHEANCASMCSLFKSREMAWRC